MKKKLTAQGPRGRQSFTVTLPIEWIKQHHLDKQREVELASIGNNLVISPEKADEERIALSLDQYKKTIPKVLQGVYRLGISELKLTFTDAKILEEVQRIQTRLIGYEIIEQGKNYLIMKDITKESSEDFSTILRRVFLLLLELSTATTQQHITSLDNNIKRLINYGQRILVKQGHADYQRVPFYYTLLHELEKIGDEYTWLLPVVQNKQLFELNSCLQKAYELLYKFNPEVYNHYQYLTFELKQQEKKSSSPVSLHHHTLARRLNTLYGLIFCLSFSQKGQEK